MQHELLHMYPILSEKKGDLVSQFKYTVAVKENGPYLVSGLCIDISKYASEHKITNEEILKILSESWDAYVPNSKKLVKVDKKASKAKKKKQTNDNKTEEKKKDNKEVKKEETK